MSLPRYTNKRAKKHTTAQSYKINRKLYEFEPRRLDREGPENEKD